MNILFFVFAAPVREVNIQKKENIITCSSEGIYPKPKLTWSTNPPSNVTNKEELETVQQIYNIKSSLVSDSVALDYTCTISNGRRARTASWYKPSKCLRRPAVTVTVDHAFVKK